MKTTIEIADDLFVRVRRKARREKTTFRALTEEGLRLLLSEKRAGPRKSLSPLVTYGGDGVKPEFASWRWEDIRDEIYRGHGA